jgi:rhamnogalacturonan endolyase
MNILRLLGAAALIAVGANLCHGQPQMEKLGRGVVAIHQPDGKIFVSWRLLGTDPDGISFNLYRQSERVAGRDADIPVAFAAGPAAAAPAAGKPVKLNAEPLTGPTWFLDESANLGMNVSYFVRPVVNGQEQDASAAFALPAGSPPRPYLSIPLKTPEGYTPGDGSVGDLDGDGEYEIVVKQEQRPQDNSRGGRTGETLLQAYKLNGTYLWTINLGKNIREGAHYTQFMVYDLDGDGKAEIVCKTADGTVDGAGKVIGDPKADWVYGNKPVTVSTTDRNGQKRERQVNPTGHVMSGPEYLTVFEGATGRELATTAYIPSRVEGSTEYKPDELMAVWGDANGNRSDRYLACVAYLDGVHPSVVMCRGYYTRSTLVAWDWRDGKLTQRWFFDSDKLGPRDPSNPWRGQGNHNLSVTDLDGDGRDEIVYGAMVVDDDGKPLYSTGWGHADTIHVGDLVPDNPGIEVFSIQERFDKQGINMRDAKTGKPIFLIPSVKADEEGGDKGEGPGRGVAFNIDPRYPGAESWARGAQMEKVGMFDAHGNPISQRTPAVVQFRGVLGRRPASGAPRPEHHFQVELAERH